MTEPNYTRPQYGPQAPWWLVYAWEAGMDTASAAYAWKAAGRIGEPMANYYDVLRHLQMRQALDVLIPITSEPQKLAVTFEDGSYRMAWKGENRPTEDE